MGAVTSVRRSVAYSVVAQYLVLAIEFASAVVVARLLTPADVGVYAVAAAIAGLGQLLRNFGVGQYIVQEAELTRDRLRAAMTVTFGTGWLIAAALYLSAPYVGGFYGQEGVTSVLHLQAVNFLFVPFGAVAMAVLTRDMNFRVTSGIRVASSVAHAGTVISTAALGAGYMSMAWASLAGTLVSVGLVQMVRPAGLPWWPGFREIRRVLRVGTYVSGVSVLGHMAGSAPDLIIGKTLGMHAVGIFSRASGLMQLFWKVIMEGVNPVILPYFASAKRDEGSVRQGYLYSLACITGLAWPFYLVLSLLVQPLIVTLFGDQWVAAGPLVQVWSIAAVIGVPTLLVESALTASGRASRAFRIQAIVSPVVIILVLIAAQYDLIWVAAAMVVASVIRVAVVWADIRDLIGVSLAEHGHAARQAVTLAGAAAVGPAVLSVIPDVGSWPAPAVVAVGGTLAAAGWLVALRITRHPLWAELQRVLRFARGAMPAW